LVIALWPITLTSTTGSEVPSKFSPCISQAWMTWTITMIASPSGGSTNGESVAALASSASTSPCRVAR
jgi:hypothetical protein